MTQTEHYQLNQWSATDKVLHTDFNADNRIIDAALAGKLGRPEQFLTAGGSASRVGGTAMYTTVIDWEKWEVVVIHPEVAQGTELKNAVMRLELQPKKGWEMEVPEGSFALVFFPGHDPSRTVKGLLLCKNPMVFTYDAPYSEFGTLAIEPTTETTIPDFIWNFIGMS